LIGGRGKKKLVYPKKRPPSPRRPGKVGKKLPAQYQCYWKRKGEMEQFLERRKARSDDIKKKGVLCRSPRKGEVE